MISEVEEYPNHGEIEDYNISVESVVTFIQSFLRRFGDDIYAWDCLAIGENDVETYGIVIGWSGGFDETDDAYIDGYALCIKLAILENAMGMDFDDFPMPYTAKGDVWDTCCEISRNPNDPSIKSDAQWIMQAWSAFYDLYMDSLEFIHDGLNEYAPEDEDWEDED